MKRTLGVNNDCTEALFTPGTKNTASVTALSVARNGAVKMSPERARTAINRRSAPPNSARCSVKTRMKGWPPGKCFSKPVSISSLAADTASPILASAKTAIASGRWWNSASSNRRTQRPAAHSVRLLPPIAPHAAAAGRQNKAIDPTLAEQQGRRPAPSPERRRLLRDEAGRCARTRPPPIRPAPCRRRRRRPRARRAGKRRHKGPRRRRFPDGARSHRRRGFSRSAPSSP